MGCWTSTSHPAVVCLAVIGMSEPASACSLVDAQRYMEAAADSVRHFWLASIFLGGLILCLDLLRRKASPGLLFAGVLLLLLGSLLYRTRQWGGYSPDCSVPLLQASQLVFGLISATLAYRAFRALRAKLTTRPGP
jgi:hypothetical protein